METAVELTELQLANWPRLRQVLQHQIVDLEQLDEAEEELKRTVAVIRYHRGLVLDAMGDAERAQEDFRRVRELGFEPNEQLF